MRKVIYLSGITSSGKTTTAKKLSEFLGIPFFSADDVYSMIARELNYKKQEQLVMPEFWKKFENFGALKAKYYKQLLKDVEGDFIIEGFPLFFEQDRQLIEQIIGEHFKTFFYITIDFTIWREWVDNKLGGKHNESDYQTLNAYFEAPEQFYRIRDIEDLFVTHDKYQREGFTDKKWELIGLKESEIKDKDVIDLGCNAGWIGQNCIDLGAKSVSGVDYNWRYLDEAREKGYHCTLSDLDDYIFDKQYDVIFCLATFHYVVDKEKFLEKVAAATKEQFILEIPVNNSENAVLTLHDTTKCQYYIPSIKWAEDQLKKYFSIIEITPSIAPDLSRRFIFKCFK